MDRPKPRFSIGRLACLATGLGALGATIWLLAPGLWAWYCVSALARSEAQDRPAWLAKTTALGQAAVPALVDCLRRDDEKACANATAGLLELARRGTPSSTALCNKLGAAFPTLSATGQCAALDLAERFVSEPNRSRAAVGDGRGLAEILQGAARSETGAAHLKGVELALRCMSADRLAEPAILPVLLRRCLRDPDAGNRVAGVQAAAHYAPELLPEVAGLLPDPVPEVRRAALLCVGSAAQAVATDDLLPWLHDPDEGVRTICETALRGRGLSEAHLRLARLLTSPEPAQRLRIIDFLHPGGELEPGVWLRRLSHDQAPAVRAAALRQAGGRLGANLRDRIEQMAQDDPSPTIRQIARFYLERPESGRSP